MTQMLSRLAAVLVLTTGMACVVTGTDTRLAPGSDDAMTTGTGTLSPGDPTAPHPDGGRADTSKADPGCVPEAERRDGRDNDCDGLVDDDLPEPPETRCDARTPVLSATPSLHAVRESAALIVARSDGNGTDEGPRRLLFWVLDLGADAVVVGRSANTLEIVSECTGATSSEPLERQACGAQSQQLWRLAKAKYILRVSGVQDEHVRFSLQVLPSPQSAPMRRLAWSSITGDGIVLGDAITASDSVEATQPACGTGRRWVQTVLSGCTPPRAIEIRPTTDTRLLVGIEQAEGTAVCSALRATHSIAPDALVASLLVTASEGVVGGLNYTVRAIE